MKKSRRKCQKAIDDDMEKIKWIDKEMESIRARLNPLTKAYEEKKARRDHLKKQLEVVSAQCTSMMNKMNSRVKNTRHMHCSLGAAEATRALEAARKSPNTCFNLKISDGSRLYLFSQDRRNEEAISQDEEVSNVYIFSLILITTLNNTIKL